MRNISHNTLSRPGRWHNTSFENTASKVLSLKGRFLEASHCSKCARASRPLVAAIWFALWTPGAFTSRPTRLQPTFFARCKAYPPEPHPTSSTDELGFKSSRRGISQDSSVVTQLV